MSKPSFLIESLGRRSLSAVLASILLLIITVSEVAPSQENKEVDTQKIIRRVAEDYIRDGKERYEKGFFEQAEKTFLMAQEYEEYLTAAARAELTELLGKAQVAVLRRKRALETFQTVNDLLKQDQLVEAKAQLMKIKDSEFLTEGEQGQVAEAIRQIEIEIAEAQASPEKAREKKPLVVGKPAKTAEETKKSGDRAAGRKEEIAGLYYRSIGFFYTGQFKKARNGFAEVMASGLMPPSVEKRIENYLAEIDGILAGTAAQKPAKKVETREPVTAGRNVAKPEINDLSPVERAIAELNLVQRGTAEPNLAGTGIAEPKLVELEVGQPKVDAQVTGEGSYIDVINLRRNILRSHATAVVSDAMVKAQRYMQQGQFDKAKEAVETAQRVVNDNQLTVGDAQFTEKNNRELGQLMEEINQRQDEMTRRSAEQRRQDAIRAQQEFTEQMEVERQERIADLMRNALAYQEQQRYEAALGQLASLLALDPQNDEALVLKSKLEDMIYFRKQLEAEREAERQRADTLLKTDVSGIPYAEELTYPRNWREITEKPTRQPDKPIGLDPADVAVYEQLGQIVDLSELTATTSLSDAIEILRNSVDPPLKIVVLWRDLLDNADIERGTEINMDGLPAVQLGTGLENLLEAVAGAFAELGFVVRNGVITIATVDSLPSRLEHRVYDVTDLVGQPAQYGGLQGLFMGQSLIQSLGGGGLGGGGYGGGGYGGGGIGGYGGGGLGGGGYGGGGYGGGGYGGGLGGGGYGGGGLGGFGGGGYGGGLGGFGGGGYGGGLGGFGGGGYGGGMGMMGGMGGMGGMGMMGMGGMGGMGGYGMGGMGMMGGAMGGYFQAQSLVQLIEETIEPDSWFDLSETGEGTITPYPAQQPKKLAVRATREVHSEIEKLLTELRKALGHQVSIEARYLVVTENFLEDIGLDVDFTANLGGKWGQVSFEQDSAIATQGEPTQVPLSLGGIGAAVGITGGYGSILDDLQVSFLLRATQAHRDAKALTAPTITVMSGESANFSIQRYVPIALPPIQQPGVTTVGVTGAQAGTATGVGGGLVPREIYVPSGSSLSITPIITHDKKNVLLDIITYQNQFLGIRTTEVEAPIVGGIGGAEVQEWSVPLPETETSQVMTRVSVPDSGTLLLGGQKITEEVEKEVGVPVLSKIPIIGRLFSNRSEIKDHKILLILVKPTIILQEEREAEAIAAMEGEI